MFETRLVAQKEILKDSLAKVQNKVISYIDFLEEIEEKDLLCITFEDSYSLEIEMTGSDYSCIFFPDNFISSDYRGYSLLNIFYDEVSKPPSEFQRQSKYVRLTLGLGKQTQGLLKELIFTWKLR